MNNLVHEPPVPTNPDDDQSLVEFGQTSSDPCDAGDDSSLEPVEKKKKRKRHYEKKYCGGCWRVEKHFALNRNKFQIRVLAILTLGLYLLVRRFRCRVCGRTRMAVGE